MGPSSVKSTSNFIIRTSRALFSVFNYHLAQSMISKSEIGGVILAGGKASRMDFRDKALEPLYGKPLLEYVKATAAPQVNQLVLSVNHNIQRYQAFGLPIISDHDASYGGPLLGILSAMHWFRGPQPNKEIRYLACFPGDVPEFPNDVVSRLAQQLTSESAVVAYICHQGQIQPLFSLWHLELVLQIEDAIAAGLVGPKLVFGSLNAIAVNYDDTTPASFCNINTAEDLHAAAQLLAKK